MTTDLKPGTLPAWVRCPERCDVNGKTVRCQGGPDLHYAHRWTQMLKAGGRMEIHWRTKPAKETTMNARIAR